MDIVAENTYIVQFFQAKKRQEVKLPSETSLETWDVKLLVDYICKELSPTDELTLYDLQQKTILLLCLHTMWRPRSDIGRIQHRDVHLKYDTDKKHLEGVTIHVREPKESQQKFTKLGLITDNTQQEVCVVKTLEKFMQKTADIRKSLPQEHSLFLTYLQDDKKDEESKSAAPSTIANWIKTHMKKAGINEAYKPHSIRSAVSTKAVMLGNSIEKVKDHANWSQASNTFEKYYYKPTMKQHSSTKIQNSIFAAENNTTSESEAKATRIVLGTSNNTTVAEAKDEEVYPP
ncbi:hypothetical protein G6F64_013295 [Rhizopus arrhizus]|uniref:Tyr recombinase domain-containing protein n=1 Tax=Rhizopus oryzae TaxID=64495 RepID=A0A9P7BKF2_RHIOR|nr:hypothetical protein G6F64_013295 [Rhizopus arrhizus]